jgi:MFS family permease
VVVIFAGYLVRRNVSETPAFAEEAHQRRVPRAPIVDAFKDSWKDMLRVVCMALTYSVGLVAGVFAAAYAVQPGYGIGFHKDVYLWIPVLGNIAAVVVIPFIGNLSDKVGRKPPLIAGALLSGLLTYAYLYAISIRNVTLTVALSVLVWGVLYQGYNAVFPSFYPELFPTRFRVTGVAIAQNIGTTITALLPLLFATLAPPGSRHVPLVIGSITFGVTIVAAIAASTARETYRTPLKDLGERGSHERITAVSA